jgi:hypothetical protein
MIRRDYILRMLAEFFEVLSRIRSLRKGQKWHEAALLTDQELERLLHGDAKSIVSLSETELLARLIAGETTLAVREKTLVLVTLLKEAGDVAAAQSAPDEGRSYYLKGLHLLLWVLAREEASDFPEFVPQVEVFLGSLGVFPLPISTQAMLMQHYERVGEFGKAEDILFSMIEAQPGSPDLLDFAVRFYERLQIQSNDALAAGNLPRAELEAGLAQVRGLKAKESPA